MKQLSNYIVEKFKISSKTISKDNDLEQLSTNEMNQLEDYFNKHCRNIKTIKKTPKGLFHIIFETSFNSRINPGQRPGRKLTISKSPRFMGGYGITILKYTVPYDYGNKYKKGTKEPLINTFNELLEVLNEKFLNGSWAESVGAELR